jgi:hypothetical protein
VEQWGVWGLGEGSWRSVGGVVDRQRPVRGGSELAARACVADAEQERGGSMTSWPEATAGFKPGQLSQKSFKQN